MKRIPLLLLAFLCSFALSLAQGGLTIGLANQLYGKDPINLVNDPYQSAAFARGDLTALTIGAADGASSYSLAHSDPMYSVRTPAIKRAYGSGTGVLGRTFAFADMGLKAGDTVTAVVAVYVPLGAQITCQAFWRTAADAVVGSIASPNSQVGPGLKVITFDEIQAPATATKLNIRFALVSASGGHDGEIYLGWGIYKRQAGANAVTTGRCVAELLSGLSVAEPRRLNVPSRLYALAGGTGSPTAIRELNLYYGNALDKWSTDTFEVTAGYGMQYGRTWRLQAGNSDYTPYNIGSGSFTATMRLKDAAKNILLSAAPTVYVSSASSTTRTSLLCVGDSWTRLNTIAKRAKSILPGTVDVVGTRSYGDDDTGLGSNYGSNAGEGRGGWLASDYVLTRWGTSGSTAGDSPFLFPTAISGARYHGNTAFWALVVGGAPGYDQDGFQWAAKGFTTGSYIFNSSGYLISPVSGDTCYDPTQSAGSQIRQYNGSTWVALPSSSATATSIGITGPSTVTRASGSFVTDGVLAGSTIYLSGFSTGANNGRFTVSTVSATSLTVTSTSLVTESASSSKFYVAATFDYSKYLARNVDAFKQTGSFVAPKTFVWHLGTNDFFAPTSIDSNSSWANYVIATDAAIASVHSYDPNTLFVIATPGVPPAEAARNRFNMMEANGRIIRRYDTAANITARTYVLGAHLAIDPDYQWPASTLPVNANTAGTTTRTVTDFVHPSSEGYYSVADVYAGFIQYARSASLI